MPVGSALPSPVFWPSQRKKIANFSVFVALQQKSLAISEKMHYIEIVAVQHKSKASANTKPINPIKEATP
jgi:hypothetical protein